MIIGVVGAVCSGKGFLSDELHKKGYIKLTFSDVLREEVKRRGIELSRVSLHDLGNELRKNHGADYLARKLLEKVEDGKNYVFDGIRNPAEIKALREFGETVILGIEAPLEKRLQWMIMRNRENDPLSIAEVKAVDDKNNGVGEPDYGLQIGKCMDMIDFKIMNNGDREQLKKNIDKVLNKINKKR